MRGPAEAVVLVHGLWLSGWSMALLGARLKARGFSTFSFSYPTVSADLKENTAALARFARNVDAPTVHFVGHSLGGVVIVGMLRERPFPLPGRVVTLGAPFGGSQAARALAKTAFGRRILGRSIAQLPAANTRLQAPPGRELGVICGSQRIGLGQLVTKLDAPHDGIVSLSEAHLAGATAELVLPVCHTCMLVSRRAAEQTCAFLQHGRFDR